MISLTYYDYDMCYYYWNFIYFTVKQLLVDIKKLFNKTYTPAVSHHIEDIYRVLVHLTDEPMFNTLPHLMLSDSEL